MAKVKFFNNCGDKMAAKAADSVFHCHCLKEDHSETEQKFNLAYGTKHETVLPVKPDSEISVSLKNGKTVKIKYDGRSTLLTLGGTADHPALKLS
ncbi:MAG TPA: hypothetical protein VMB03_03000 [Bryobacteraceae bacterium]|nr:hypothetical protein [Bryobacteraceae bacterium]